MAIATSCRKYRYGLGRPNPAAAPTRCTSPIRLATCQPASLAPTAKQPGVPDSFRCFETHSCSAWRTSPVVVSSLQARSSAPPTQVVGCVGRGPLSPNDRLASRVTGGAVKAEKPTGSAPEACIGDRPRLHAMGVHRVSRHHVSTAAVQRHKRRMCVQWVAS